MTSTWGWDRSVEVVALRRHDDGARRLRLTDRPPLRLPNGALLGVVATVEQPGVGKIAVVRHVDAVRRDPHVRADHHLREEEAVVVARLDAGDLDVRRDPGDADAIDRGGDRACRVRAMTDEVVAGQQRLRSTARAVCAVRGVVVRGEVGVGEVEARVDVADDDLRAAAGDVVGGEGVDLPHVPLQPGKGLEIAGSGRNVAGERAGPGLSVADRDAEVPSGHCVLDPAHAFDRRLEPGARRTRDHDADLAVVGDECPAGRLHRGRSTRAGSPLAVEDDVRRVGAGCRFGLSG